MKNTKKIKIFFILIIFFLLISTSCISQASASDIIQQGEDFISDGSNPSNPLVDETTKPITDKIYNLMLLIGIVIAAIVGVALGIQFVTGSAGQKTKVKESLFPYIAGCIVIFGAFGIWKLVITILNGSIN